MTRTKGNMLYTCTAFGCVIECPCNICTSSNIHSKLQLAGALQCGAHQIKVSHMFDVTSDLYTLVTDDSNTEKYRYAYGYAGIPSSCEVCSQDVLEHQIYHLVYHTTCRYCKFEFRPLEILLENNFEFDYKDAVKFVDADDNKTCSVCLKKCKDKYARVKHENTVHTNEPQKYQCDLCARSYSSLDALSYHVAKKHQVSVQKYSCDLCGSQFATPATLARHKKIIHESENSAYSKQFECEFCSKTFSLASNMKRHEQELHFGPKLNLDFHEGLEPAKFFQCETCEKKFTRKTYLKHHIMNIHSKTDYDCGQCKSSFGRQAALDRHIQ